MIKGKVAYLVVGENLNSELLRRQVVELLGVVKSKEPNLDVTLFLFHGVLTLINRRNDIRQSKKILKDLDIRLVVIPNICPWPVPNLRFIKTDVGWRPYSIWNRFAASLFTVLTLPLMLILRLVLGYKLYHCRSYPATSAAIALKHIVPDTSVIFDPRSDFPEENVTSGSWSLNSKNFLYWKSAEKRFLINANAVALIGPTYLEHYMNNVSSFSYFYVPNNVDFSFFKRNSSTRVIVRKELAIDEDEKVYVYLGGMSRSGWHRPDFYVEFYDQLERMGIRFKILFIVPKFVLNIVKKAFDKRAKIIVVSIDFSDVGKYLSAADYGVMFLHKSKIAVGTKIGEYLSASLPIIVNNNCIGACRLINEHPMLGKIITLGLGDLDTVVDVTNEQVAFQPMQQSISDFALNYFDNSAIANQYLRKYKELLQ